MGTKPTPLISDNPMHQVERTAREQNRQSGISQASGSMLVTRRSYPLEAPKLEPSSSSQKWKRDTVAWGRFQSNGKSR